MNLSSNTILITGGATGIGYAIAERFLARGNQLILVGRREDKLKEAKAKHPGLHTRVCDVANDAERRALAEWARTEFPRLNVLVNNAGVQRRVKLTDAAAWDAMAEELRINLEAPMHLTHLLLPHLLGQPRAAILNVTSGLSFVPMSAAPAYCATKAALHSYTLSLRHQVRGTPVEVIEIIPPAVNTDLGGAGLHTFGTPLDEFADAVFRGLEAQQAEITHGFSEKASLGSKAERDEMFRRLNPTA